MEPLCFPIIRFLCRVTLSLGYRHESAHEGRRVGVGVQASGVVRRAAHNVPLPDLKMVQKTDGGLETQQKEAFDREMVKPADAMSVHPIIAGGIGSSGVATIQKGLGSQSCWEKSEKGRMATLSSQQEPMSTSTDACNIT